MKAKSIKFSNLSSVRKPSAPTKKTKKFQVEIRRIKQRRVRIRKVLPRKKRRRERIYYDDLDKSIMSRMKHTRSLWSDEEDKILLLAQSVNAYLCPQWRRRSLPHTVVRDYMHRRFPDLPPKTSKAYHRRIVTLVKFAKKQHGSKTTKAYSIFADHFVQKYFKRIRDAREHADVNVAFLYLLDYIRGKSEEPDFKSDVCTDYLTREYVSRCEKAKTDSGSIYEPAATRAEVEDDFIKSLLHSSLLLKQTDIKWNLKLFNIYKTYSDQKLRSVAMRLRDQQLISGKKATPRVTADSAGVNLSGITYQLSFTYMYKQMPTYPPCVYEQILDYLLDFSRDRGDSRRKIGIETFENGHALALGELFDLIPVDFTLKLPKNFLELETSQKNVAVLVEELGVRYRYLSLKLDTPLVKYSTAYDLSLFLGDDLNGVEDKIRDILERSLTRENTVGSVAHVAGGRAELEGRSDQEDDKLTNLAFLLNKGIFPELDKDNEMIDELNALFQVIFPSVDVILPANPRHELRDLLAYSSRVAEVTRKIEE